MRTDLAGQWCDDCQTQYNAHGNCVCDHISAGILGNVVPQLLADKPKAMTATQQSLLRDEAMRVAVFRSSLYWVNAAIKANTLAESRFFAENARNHLNNALHALGEPI